MLRGEKLNYRVPMPLVMNNGGIGDWIACMPAIYALLKNYPQLDLKYYIQKPFITLFKAFMAHAGYKIAKKDLITLVPNASLEFTQALYLTQAPHTSMRTHLVDFAFQCYLDRPPLDDAERAYPTFDYTSVPLERFGLPKDYVVVCTGYTAPARAWSSKEINKVISWLSQNGYTPVFIGSSNVSPGVSGVFEPDIKFDKGLDLRESTSLIQATAILGQANAVVGVDNGLLHLAACTSTPIVAGFPTVDPEQREYIRPNGVRMENARVVVPEVSLKCRWCQSRLNFVTRHDFKQCYYGDYKCRDHMSGEKFIAALKDLL